MWKLQAHTAKAAGLRGQDTPTSGRDAPAKFKMSKLRAGADTLSYFRGAVLNVPCHLSCPSRGRGATND